MRLGCVGVRMSLFVIPEPAPGTASVLAGPESPEDDSVFAAGDGELDL